MNMMPDSVAHELRNFSSIQILGERPISKPHAGDSPYCDESWQIQICTTVRNSRPPAEHARNNQHEETFMPSLRWPQALLLAAALASFAPHAQERPTEPVKLHGVNYAPSLQLQGQALQLAGHACLDHG